MLLPSHDHPPTALAPMQDVTTLAFMSTIGELGAPDYFFTEYFRVHETSTLEKHILASITENKTGKPVFAQLIGENLTHLKRTVNELLKYPIAGIDLNMGCPAPKVYRKNVGGGLLRDLNTIDGILGCLRDAVPGLFTVKMRIGFDNTDSFSGLLDLINKHQVDLLSLHARTVKEMYRSEVHYEFIKQAAATVTCPVFANGNITSAEKAAWVLKETGCWGVMIGRSAFRNPWIFRQTREYLQRGAYFKPMLADVYQYIEKLYQVTGYSGIPEINHISRMKKFLNFVGLGVDAEGNFLKAMRRTTTQKELFDLCDKMLLADGNDQKLFANEPYDGLIARPNAEGELTCG